METIFLILNIFLILIISVNCDVSHIFPDVFHQIQHLYAPPIVVSTTEEPFIPEIIINKNNYNGYDYNLPEGYLPPVQVDETPQQPLKPPVITPVDQDVPHGPPSQYLPPNRNLFIKNQDFLSNYVQAGYDYNVPTLIPPFVPSPAPGADVPLEPEVPENVGNNEGYNYEVPSQQPSPPPGYLPPTLPRNAKDFDKFNSNTKSSVKIQVREMRCLNYQGGYFKAILRIDSIIGAVPIVDNELTDSRCDVRLSQSHVIIAIGSENFHRCGIRQCGPNLCLRLRFPLIRGMKTVSDSLLTLQCKVQDRIAVKTHSVKMGISNEIQGRSLGAYAHGGSQQPFRTHIELLKKSANGFNRHVDPNGSVQLGEELLLRAHVLHGDGWNFTKLTDVNLQRLSPNGDVLNAANLITSSGCINPTMHSVCPHAPSFEPPLGHRLFFKAVMFQGMRSGDEIIMNMKITGCIERTDCFVNSQICGNHNRVRRSPNNNKTMTELSEISTISFRVEIPEEVNNKKIYSTNKNYNLLPIYIFIGFGLSFFLILGLIYLKFK